jgi:hypothetical protein
MHRTVALTLLLLAALTGRDALMAAEIMTPLERVASTPKGQLKSPYPDFAKIADEGRRKYRLQWLPRRWGRWRDGRTSDKSNLDLRR